MSFLFQVAPGRLHRKRKTIVANKTPATFTLAEVNVEGFDGVLGVVTALFALDGASLNNPVDSGADPTKWSAVYDGTLYVGNSFVFDGGNALTINLAESGASEGENSLSYSADPSDISDTNGQMLAGVVKFPI